jgi:hypothetical protein
MQRNCRVTARCSNTFFILILTHAQDEEELPRNCTLFQQPRRCTHRLRLGEAAQETHYISPLARNRYELPVPIIGG